MAFEETKTHDGNTHNRIAIIGAGSMAVCVSYFEIEGAGGEPDCCTSPSGVITRNSILLRVYALFDRLGE